MCLSPHVFICLQCPKALNNTCVDLERWTWFAWLSWRKLSNCEHLSKRLLIAEELGPNVEANDAWSTNALILDAILKYLTVQEVKILRLVSKSFCVAGARPLVRKTLIRLTGIVKLRPVSETIPVLTAHNSSDSDFWNCACGMDSQFREYFHMDAYSEYLGSATFNSGFEPKEVSVVSGADVWQLPLPHFSSLEKLQVLTYRPSQGLKLLHEFHVLFPNLKTLELRSIQADSEVTESKSVRRTWSTSSDEMEAASEILLEKLAITVSSDWKYIGAEVLRNYRKLKSLTLNWTALYPRIPWGRLTPYVPAFFENRYNLDGEQYIDWLLGPEFPLNFPLLNDMSLRLDLLPNTTSAALDVLNGMKLKKLSLELYGNGVEFSRFINGLSTSTVAALSSVLSSCLHQLADHERPSREHIEKSMLHLGDKGFFAKPEWALTFHVLTVQPGWCYFVRSESQFRFEVSDSLLFNFARVLPSIVFKYLKEASASSSYNYSFRRFRLTENKETVVRYAYENMGPENVFHYPYQPHCKAFPGIRDYELRGRFVRQLNCNCLTLCNKPNLLLCEIPGFLQESGLSEAADHKHSYWWMSTFTMTHVQPEILKKWTDIRELERDDSGTPNLE